MRLSTFFCFFDILGGWDAEAAPPPTAAKGRFLPGAVNAGATASGMKAAGSGGAPYRARLRIESGDGGGDTYPAEAEAAAAEERIRAREEDPLPPRLCCVKPLTGEPDGG